VTDQPTEHAHTGSEHANEHAALRDRINAALNDSEDRCARCKHCDTQLDAAMAVVQSVLDRLNKEVERLADEMATAEAEVVQRDDQLDQEQKRTEAAERERDQLQERINEIREEGRDW
jgi:chromosome segregation ATPase